MCARTDRRAGRELRRRHHQDALRGEQRSVQEVEVEVEVESRLCGCVGTGALARPSGAKLRRLSPADAEMVATLVKNLSPPDRTSYSAIHSSCRNKARRSRPPYTTRSILTDSAMIRNKITYRPTIAMRAPSPISGRNW